ncbi:hypothetical protein [Janthinobacterium sp. BJB446]|uniref:hypothetical protein n=1 Tax=Janthinobacterium sp. BJB446 TaxID=2048009 RepID=UPI00117A920E|nr:hypothetical protein [Janthinobacterium sp. BJB446]
MNAKITSTELPKTTNDHKSTMPSNATTVSQTATAGASISVTGPIKNAATPISSIPTADTTGNEGKLDTGTSSSVKAEKTPKAQTKMEIASAIYLRTSKQKNMSRKQIVEQFVAEAKLSAAGASTYYQLIKAKLG